MYSGNKLFCIALELVGIELVGTDALDLIELVGEAYSLK